MKKKLKEFQSPNQNLKELSKKMDEAIKDAVEFEKKLKSILEYHENNRNPGR